eukprot:2148685-Amphidinium_carterae.1
MPTQSCQVPSKVYGDSIYFHLPEQACCSTNSQDSNNSQLPSCVIAFGDYEEGEFWVEDPAGTHCCLSRVST